MQQADTYHISEDQEVYFSGPKQEARTNYPLYERVTIITIWLEDIIVKDAIWVLGIN